MHDCQSLPVPQPTSAMARFHYKQGRTTIQAFQQSNLPGDSNHDLQCAGEGPCLLTYFVTTYWQLFVLRALTGISIGGCLPLVFNLLGDLFDAQHRANVLSGVLIATGAGTAIGQALAGLIGSAHGPCVDPMSIASLQNCMEHCSFALWSALSCNLFATVAAILSVVHIALNGQYHSAVRPSATTSPTADLAKYCVHSMYCCSYCACVSLWACCSEVPALGTELIRCALCQSTPARTL